MRSKLRNATESIACLFLLALFALGSPTARAAGQAIHLRAADLASELYVDEPLRGLLRSNAVICEGNTNSTDVKDYYLNGVSFPDAVSLGFPQGHHAAFLNNYINAIVSVQGCGRTVEGYTGNAVCAALISHFMGVLAHVVTDNRFDRYALERVNQRCQFFDSGDSEVNLGSQQYTDKRLDTAHADFWPASRPACIAVPDLMHHLLGWTSVRVQNRVLNLWDYIDGQESIADDARNLINSTIPTGPNGQCPAPGYRYCCPWALLHLERDLIGGPNDTAPVVADYINKTWELLTAGRVQPAVAARGSRPGAPPRAAGRQPLVLFEDDRSFLQEKLRIIAPDGTRFDFNWVKAKQGVSKFQIESFSRRDPTPGSNQNDYVLPHVPHPLFAVLVGDTLQTIDVRNLRPGGNPDFWQAQRSNVVDFQIDVHRASQRIAVVEADRVLFVKDGIDPALPWVEVARDVVDFRLDEDRIAVLQDRSRPTGAALRGRRRIQESVLRIKKGAADSDWILTLTDRIASFQLEGDRIAVLLGKNGRRQTLLVKDLLDPDWIELHRGRRVDQVQLYGSKVAVLIDGEVLVKETLDQETWTLVAPLETDPGLAVTRFRYHEKFSRADQTYFGRITADGNFYLDTLTGDPVVTSVTTREKGKAVDFDLNDVQHDLGCCSPSGSYYSPAGKQAWRDHDGALFVTNEDQPDSSDPSNLAGIPDDRQIRQFGFGEEWLGVLVGDTLYVRTEARFPW